MLNGSTLNLSSGAYLGWHGPKQLPCPYRLFCWPLACSLRVRWNGQCSDPCYGSTFSFAKPGRWWHIFHSLSWKIAGINSYDFPTDSANRLHTELPGTPSFSGWQWGRWFGSATPSTLPSIPLREDGHDSGGFFLGQLWEWNWNWAKVQQTLHVQKCGYHY